MTTSELIALLQRRLQRWGDLHVKVTWESTDHELAARNVYRGVTFELIGNDLARSPVLFINGDAGDASSDPTAVDPHEGEDGT